MKTREQLANSETQSPPSTPRFKITGLQKHARSWMTIVLVMADTCGLLIAGFAGIGLRMMLSELINPPFYWKLIALIPVFLLVFALRGLYPAVGLSPVVEMRRLTFSTTIVFLFFTTATFWFRSAEYFSRLVIAFSWGFAIITIPMCRWLFRVIATNSGLWGEPVAVVGNGPQTQRTAKFLLERMRLGIRPVVIIDDTGNIDGSLVPKLAIDHFLSNAGQMRGIQTAVLVDSELSETLRNSILDKQSFEFKRLILISDFGWIGSLGVTPYDLESLLGLEIRQNLLNKWDQRVKRLVDITVSLMMGVITLPFTLLISLLIPLDSRGSIFYGHARIGKKGKPFIVWKFRTMVANADQVLANYLTDNSVARAEWQATQKLRHDPRVTRVGGFLRRTSLDELPQIWNVLKGEMSLVGPRPIVTEEIERYQQGYLLYQRVRPGITGLWQVSGRTNVGYADRLHYDEYYVRNWSIWLDIYILLRTIWVVIRGEGAY